MKAIIIAGPGDARMIETEKPDTGPGDVLIKIVYSGICGTDLAILGGDMNFIREGQIRYPVRIGHEWSGIVEKVGKNVKRIKPGDRVVGDNGVTCGECENCRNGNMNGCTNARSVGTLNAWDGSFAEYMVMPERHVFKLPDNVSMEDAALLEPASIALACVKHGGITPQSNVLVVGTGPIGLATVALAKVKGASKVILSGRKQRKLEVGKNLGADSTVDVTREDLKESVLKATGSKGVNIVIETSGNIDTINQCVDVIEPRGTIILAGFYETDLNHLNIDKLVMKMLNVKGIMGELGLINEVMDMMAARKLDINSIITHRFKFSEAIQVMKTANELNDTKIKMLVEITAV